MVILLKQHPKIDCGPATNARSKSMRLTTGAKIFATMTFAGDARHVLKVTF